MKQLLPKHAPRVVGCIFILAAVGKLLNPNTATSALESLEVPYRWAEAVIFVVTVLEFYLGVILLLHRDLKWGLGASTALIFIFALFLWYLSRFASPPSCGCLGLTKIFATSKQEALFGLLRNVLLLWILKAGYDYYIKRPGANRVA